jgi:C-terminal processing protease CtpA/Prc
MVHRTLVLAVAVCSGAGAGAWAVSRLTVDRTPPTTAGLVERLVRSDTGDVDPRQMAQVVESLVQVLDEEIAERRVLAEQLDETRAELNDLQQNLHTRVETAFRVAAEERTSASGPHTTANGEQTAGNRLEAAGFTLEQVANLQRRQAEAQMQQIDLDDRARREGWINTPRYAEEMAKLPDGIATVRNELGDDAYDRYLFASGRPNRIEVTSVIQTSPAESAGLRQGDIIASYGGEKIFSTQQLTDLRSTGERGSAVTLDIIRDGQAMRITMRRGPMGIQTQPTLVDPDATGG